MGQDTKDNICSVTLGTVVLALWLLSTRALLSPLNPTFWMEAVCSTDILSGS
jgi:hypothetical protein